MSEFNFIFATVLLLTQMPISTHFALADMFRAFPHTVVYLRRLHKYQPIRAATRGLFILLVTCLYYVEARKPVNHFKYSCLNSEVNLISVSGSK